MSSIVRLTIEELDRDRLSRAGKFTIGKKSILTPNFCTFIQRPDELETLMELKSQYPTETSHLGSYIVRFFDAHKIIRERLQRSSQQDLLGRSVEADFLSFAEKNVLFVDPSMEYLLYEPLASKFLPSNPL